MIAHFQGFGAHFRLWVHLSKPKSLKLLSGADARAHFQGFRGQY